MEISDLKNVVGEVKTGKVARIKFFGHISYEMTRQFNNEFEFLEQCIQPSRIDILINSEGGSVLHGMSTFSVIQGSTIPTKCIIEGMAASMASVIWSSGHESFMRDYSILMIHNPFLPEHKEEETPSVVMAFTKQLETIYQKRFGLPKNKVKDIMAGKDGEDGTYFDANQAVDAGIIPKENVIKTSKQVVEKVKAQLTSTTSTKAMQDILDITINEVESDFKQSNTSSAIHTQESPSRDEEKTQNNIKMAEKTEDAKTVGFVEASIALQMGMTSFDPATVSARLSELIGVEASYNALKITHNNLTTDNAGKDASIQNLTQNLQDTQAKLSVYQEQDRIAKEASVDALVQEAIDAGKVLPESKKSWVEAAGVNFELVQSTFASISPREKISEEIKNDPENVQAAQKASMSLEQQLAEQVAAAIGGDFSFKKID